MRTVLRNHDEVCHVWAQQQQSEGRASRIFFEGERIYSYGRHFEMARFIDPETVFVTTQRYSMSTAKHLSIVRRAVSHKTVFEVPSFTDHAENVAHFITSAREQFDKAKRARTHVTWCISSAHQYRDKVSEYIARFGYAVVPAEHIELWNAIQAGTYLDGDVQAALLKKEREAKKAEQEAAKRKREASERQEAERLEKWVQGELDWGRFSAMRLRVHEDAVQTTHGASVPVIEARKLYRAMKAGVNIEGQQVGYYRVTRVTESELVIGCHNIPLSEVERIAPEVMSKLLVEV